MDQVHENILKQMRRNIIDDLDVFNGIILPLTTEYILKEEDVNNIRKGKNKQERAQILLDMLPHRGPLAFEVFHQSLRNQYWWLSEEMDKMLESTATSVSNNDNSFFYPNLQPVSPLTVTRQKMIGQLKDSLNMLKPNGYIVLHGMKGFGKSCLAASTLKDKDLVLKLFNNEIYWIKFGYKRIINEEIVIQLNNLYHQIQNLNSTLETVNSELLEETLYQAIKYHFRQSIHRNALLILDDVCQSEVVDKFDFDCKTLVITSDIGVLNKRSYITVKMDHGFTEKETLGLFAKVLDIAIDRLPVEAKLIHEECKGMPLLIAMFAAQFENFKHDMKTEKGRWEYYLNCLKTKNAKNKVIEEFMKIQEATFDMCISQLDGEMKKRYENLAIFSEDVNIMPKTLEILWDEEPYSVDDQMLDFCHKSLAAKKWNDDLRSYVYGVHDLLLCHLRKKLTPTQLKDKHRSFIEKCKNYCNRDFSKLPNDNYIFSYIGHHLEQAEMFEEFNKLYMNFDFLQAKINYTGLSDLFIDMKKYRKYITKNGDKAIESNLVNLEHFLENNANTLAKHTLMKCLDLIQIALNHYNEGFIPDTAEKLALLRPFSLYLIHHSRNNMTNPYSNFCEEVTMNASTVAFTNEPNHILVGGHDGKIILWDCENRQSKVFTGHEKRTIKKIIVSMSGDHFLALSENGILKLFTLTDIECESDRFSIPVQSPRYKQNYWTGLFESQHDDSLKTFCVDSELITDMKFAQNNNSDNNNNNNNNNNNKNNDNSNDRIIACTDSGTVQLWDFHGNLKWQDKYKNHYFGGVSFTSGDNLLHVMDETISVIRIYKKNLENYIYVSQFNLQLNNPKVIYFSKHPVEDNCLIVVTDKVALYFKWFYNNNEHIHSYEKYIKTEEKDVNTRYVAATLTYDARYLIIGNSNGIISVMKAFNPDDLITYFKGNVTSLDSYWMNHEDFHVICGSEKRWIHRWKIRADEKPKSVKEILFDAKVRNLGQDDTIILKTAPSVITVFNEKKTTKVVSSHGKITNIKLDDDAEKVIYVTESGSVILYEMKNEKSTQISKLTSVNCFIDVLQMKNNFLVLAKAENNCLQVWRNIKISKCIEDSDSVIFVHKVNESSLITVAKNGKIKYWLIEDFEWRELYEFGGSDDITTIYSCLSSYKHYLALLAENQNVLIYKLTDEKQINEFKVEIYLKHSYKQQLQICEFSNDEKYLAVALDDGIISVVELETLFELGRLSLHGSCVCQLLWSPVSISTPILLSVSCDELAWWNVAFLNRSPLDKGLNRRSRMGFFSRSASTPAVGSSTSSTKISSSQSAGAYLSDLSYKSVAPIDKVSASAAAAAAAAAAHNWDEYWSRKLPVHSDSLGPAFLGCVQLPSSCTGKVTVRASSDFSQFLTVDIHGTISSYTLFTGTPL